MNCIGPRLLVVGSNCLRSNLGAKTIRDTHNKRAPGVLDYGLVREIAKNPTGQAVFGLAVVAKRELGAKVTPIALQNASRAAIPIAKSHPHAIFMPIPGPAPKLKSKKAAGVPSQRWSRASPLKQETQESDIRIGNKPVRLSSGCGPRPVIPVVERPSFYMSVTKPPEIKKGKGILSFFKRI